MSESIKQSTEADAVDETSSAEASESTERPCHLIVMARQEWGGYARIAQWQMAHGSEPRLVDGTEEGVATARAFLGRLCKHLRGEGTAS